MKSSRKYWLRWAETLRRYQLHELTASILEAGSPVALLGAQALYFGRGLIASDQLTALAQTLEEEDEARAFASFLNSSTISEKHSERAAQ
jgi:hypothetical protein